MQHTPPDKAVIRHFEAIRSFAGQRQSDYGKILNPSNPICMRAKTYIGTPPQTFNSEIVLRSLSTGNDRKKTKT